MSGLDQFKAPSKLEQEKKEQDLKEIQDNIKRVAALGAECLNDPKFKKYRDEVEALRAKILNAMKEHSNPDPVKDAFFLRACVNKMDVLDMLLDLIKKDVRKGRKR